MLKFINDEIKNIKGAVSDFRDFGMGVAIFLPALIVAFLMVRNKGLFVLFLAILFLFLFIILLLPKLLRRSWFAAALITVIGLNVVLFIRNAGNAEVIIGISAGFFLVSSAVPILLKPVYYVWMILVSVINYFVTRIILFTLFYLMITPLGIILRLTGKDFMGIKSKRDSYWIKKEDIIDKKQYEKQF